MKRYLQTCSILLLLLTAIACGDKTAPENNQTSSGSSQTPIFRSLSPQELYEGSIPGSQLIPFNELAQGRMTLPTGKPILLICAVGGRSYAVGQYFSGKGYGEIYNLAGGISAWKAAGLPLQQK